MVNNENHALKDLNCGHSRTGRAKPNRYDYIARKGGKIDRLSIEKALQSSNEDESERSKKRLLESSERTGK